MEISEQILYEDEELLVCYKPAGIAVQTPRASEEDMVSLLKKYRVQCRELPYIGLVHRLDQPVEGVMVFAKTKEAAAALGRQMRERKFEKRYYAVVCGRLPERKGVLIDYLLRDGRNNISKVVPAHTKDAKKAVLYYDVLAEYEEPARTLVQVHLETGRHHQIRVQLAHAGCPLVGDRKYNPGEAANEGNVALCSGRIAFRHPKTGKALSYQVTPKGETFSKLDYFPSRI